MPYRMPDVEVGQVVFWFPDGNVSLAPQAGVVSRVSAQSVCVNLFDPGTYTMLIRDGVKHASDPTLRAGERREMGAWDYTTRDKKLALLEQRVAELESALAAQTQAGKRER